MGCGIGASVAARVERLGGFLSQFCLLGGLGVGSIGSLKFCFTSTLSPSVPFPASWAFPFSACQASRWESRCQVGFGLTIFVEEAIIPQGDHYLLRGGFLDNIFLEGVVTCSGSLLVLAEG